MHAKRHHLSYFIRNLVVGSWYTSRTCVSKSVVNREHKKVYQVLKSALCAFKFIVCVQIRVETSIL